MSTTKNEVKPGFPPPRITPSGEGSDLPDVLPDFPGPTTTPSQPPTSPNIVNVPK